MRGATLVMGDGLRPGRMPSSSGAAESARRAPRWKPTERQRADARPDEVHSQERQSPVRSPTTRPSTCETRSMTCIDVSFPLLTRADIHGVSRSCWGCE